MAHAIDDLDIFFRVEVVKEEIRVVVERILAVLHHVPKGLPEHISHKRILDLGKIRLRCSKASRIEYHPDEIVITIVGIDHVGAFLALELRQRRVRFRIGHFQRPSKLDLPFTQIEKPDLSAVLSDGGIFLRCRLNKGETLHRTVFTDHLRLEGVET